MFALKSETNLKVVEDKNLNIQGVTDKILIIYKKLKKIARVEINSKTKFEPAKLTSQELNQLKSLESSVGLCLVAYKEGNDLSEQKIQILNQINKLLNDYSGLITQDDFSKFFE